MTKKISLKERIRKRLVFESRKLEPYLSDKRFLQIRFWLRVGYWPDLDNPKTFNEKLNWLKLHDIHPEYTRMVDKVTAKEYVASIIGSEYIIPTLGVWNSVDDIDWDSLPQQFVLKNTGDIEAAKAKLVKKSETNYYKYNKEYPYKDLSPRIIAEEYMEDESGYELKDYKFFCFDGEPKYLFVATDRQKKGEDTKFDFFDLDWNHLPITNGHPNNPLPIDKPQNFNEMIEIARKLSVGKTHVRVDLYKIRGKIYFGELTFFHWSGMVAYNPREWDYKFGEYIKLP